jgi:cytochrome c biogenesis protein ResB
MNPLASLWNWLGRPSLTFHLLLALVVDLLAGFFIFQANPQLFGPLNRLNLVEWIATYGVNQLQTTWWFFAFLLLLAGLVLNTAVCTLTRLAAWARLTRNPADRLDRWLSLAPHVMHLAFIVILVSHLVNYVVGVNDQNNILVQGSTLRLPGSEIELRLNGVENDFYHGDRLGFFQNRPLTQRVKLNFSEPGGRQTAKVLGINDPIWFAGYSLHLKSYAPDHEGGMKRTPFVNLIIRQDPGIRLFAAGTCLFVTGLLAYLFQALRNNGRKDAAEMTT